VTRLRFTNGFNELPAGEYEVLYVLPAAGVLQIAPTTRSLGLKDKPAWDVVRQRPGVEIECSYCRGWFDVDGVPLDEVHGWRCSACRGGRLS
jgi:hypothetical protein